MCLGQLNAYVEQGATREERLARLAEVPVELRAAVENHVRTVFALRKRPGKRRRRYEPMHDAA